MRCRFDSQEEKKEGKKRLMCIRFCSVFAPTSPRKLAFHASSPRYQNTREKMTDFTLFMP